MRIQFLIFQLITRGLILLAGWLPRRWGLGIGGALGRLAFAMMRERAQVALDNLELVYGGTLTPAGRLELARRNFAHLGGVMFETLHVLGRPRALRSFLTIEGAEHLQAALQAGRGVVIFSGHIGNFILLGAGLAPVCSFKFIFRDPGDPAASALYAWLRRRIHMETIADNPRQVCAYQAHGHLRSGGVLGVLIDQVENGGVYVDFMGHLAGSTLGAVKLALASRALLVPAFCIRQSDTHLRLVIEPEYVIPDAYREPDAAKNPEMLMHLVGDMNKIVEKMVRAYPEQWLWGHRRWRQWRK